MSEPEHTHTLQPYGQMADTMQWLAARGLIGAAIGNQDTGAPPVLLIGKPGATPIMAQLGNTLRWDGNALTVETGERP